MADIYLITNLINGKQYVGQTIHGYMNRWKSHCWYADHPDNCNEYVQVIDLAIKKYGKQNFKVELLESVPVSEKDAKEIEYIAKYNTLYTGYNLTAGGDINPMSNANVRKRHKCSMNSIVTKQRISKSVKEAYTPQLRKWFSNHSKAVWQGWSDEERQNCIRGIMRYNDSRKQKVAIVTEAGSIVKIFQSASEACIYCNRLPKEAGHILNVCNKFNKNGKRAKHFGYSWIKL